MTKTATLMWKPFILRMKRRAIFFDNRLDPIEAGLRERVRGFIETMLDTKLDAVLAPPVMSGNWRRSDEIGVTDHHHGRRTRTLTRTIGTTEIAVPRAPRGRRGQNVEWKSKALRAYQRPPMVADALIASVHLAGTNLARAACACRLVRRRDRHGRQPHLRKVKTDWDAWNARQLAESGAPDPHGTVVRVRLDREATSISLLVVIRVRTDGQKILRGQEHGQRDDRGAHVHARWPPPAPDWQ
ncbi:MAG: hypothetical protein E5X67_33780 [Mesorhizobium sp.]|uniref:transposase n=1 Tax=Mesorhizobium sp. TaxID=1871066 RepID=UPI00121B1ECE|nr:transposase [Mesorhizobium sp.]TIP23328.1 MAG: hypothetical protein E5X67_33780 [Mesorhizobium sp.]